MLRVFFIALCLSPFVCFSQYTVTGKVSNQTNKKPVADASVFLSNTLAGTKTTEYGTFKLTNVRPGQYDLVITSIGFETFHQPVLVNTDVAVPAIEMSTKTILLREVRIGTNINRNRNYEMFKRLFLGTSSNAYQCKILNPNVININYNPVKLRLTASSDDFIEIENKALGYKIRYLLTDFSNDDNSRILYFEGSALFEELPGSPGEQRRWAKNRLKAFQGSSMHFLRSVITNNIDQQGFKMLRMIRKLDTSNPDTLHKKYGEALINIPLQVNEVVNPTDAKGVFALSFKDALYIMYSKKMASDISAATEKTAAKKTDKYYDWTTTTIIFDEPYTFFDFNRIIINPHSVIFDGEWGKNFIADLLPADYVP
jgi:hypothetical protein